MTFLALAGIGLFLAAPWMARLIMGRERDPIALVRMLQLIAIAMLIGAILTRPYNRETTAVPPPPDVPDTRTR